MSVSATVIRIEAVRRDAPVHLREARRVPDLGREIAVALDLRWMLSLMSRPCAAIAARVKRSASAPYRSMRLERIDDVALRLRHLGAVLVADEGVDVDRVEGHFVHEIRPIIIIRATQKKMMSKPVTRTFVG